VWQDDEINYGGPAVYDDFPNTFKPAFERRSWRIEEERKNVHAKFIVYTANSYFNDTINKYYKDIEVMRLYDCLFLVKNNKRTTVDFVRYINAATDGI
jgi:hypothetical protein